MINFKVEIERVVDRISPIEVKTDPIVPVISGIILDDIDSRYGEQSEKPLAHHNAFHGLERADRTVEVTNLLYPDIPEEYSEGIYSLGILDGTAHDWMQDFKVFGLNEELSAAFLGFMLKRADREDLFDDRFMARAFSGIRVTTAVTETDGNVHQPYLLEGKPDPNKFIQAFTDVDAIALGGMEEMFKTCENIVKELYKDPSPRQFYDFLRMEEPFLRKRLNPIRMMAVLGHFFPVNAKEVYEKMYDSYNKNIVDAYEFAQEVGRRSDIADEIGEALRAGEYEGIGQLIGKAVILPQPN
ncbi:MAG TPA: hypothetical protein VD947_01995 [Patescibacteria group bacterium]|nr:hypothetical protein [Patescibacteria group bacterium]